MKFSATIADFFLTTLIFDIASASPHDAHQRHVVFENSSAPDCYFHSKATSVAPSELEILDERCPIDAERFVSPPNSLRLKWTSRSGGDWRMMLSLPTRYGQRFELRGEALSLWCYSVEGLTREAAPRIGVTDAENAPLPDISLLESFGDLPAGQWVEVRLPFARFKGLFLGTSDFAFDGSKLAAVTLAQGLDDGQTHTLYVDDFRIVEATTVDHEAPSPPDALKSEGFELHIDLTWESSKSSDVCNYRIYRSDDGRSYLPIGTRPAGDQRYCDFLGRFDVRAQYKVAAVDLANNESTLSEPVDGATRQLDDDQLLQMVQKACFRYYWEGANRDSGMAVEILPGDENLVAVGASGFGVMALVVAAESGFVTREQGAERMLKMVRFLSAADRFHGVWPHFLDGRTGRVRPFFGVRPTWPSRPIHQLFSQ